MDSVANMLTTLVNAQRVRKERVAVPYSAFHEALANLLQAQGVISKIRVQKGAVQKLILTLAYDDGVPKVSSVRRLSRPGQRRYVAREALPYRGRKPGFFVVSTSQGLLDVESAREKGLGGELVCEINVN